MTYTVEFTSRALKQLKKLDKAIAGFILNYIERNLNGCSNPRIMGSPLKGNHKGKWRYRAGNYRILCMINDYKITILIIDIGHRKEIYKY
ncbi:MAG: type II toxin-antitoxin system RelE/ParE family toxin [Clostridia bacterium]|nr:type II toxin-antitoxin system RelE/ParE family toxin [Clostridia bacterium]